MSAVVSRTDLARNTRAIVDQVRNGQTVVVQSHGQDQIVLLDALDYRILNALAKVATAEAEAFAADTIEQVMYDYSHERISLAKAAEVLRLPRFDLAARFERLDIPLRIGPATLDDARDEVRAAYRE
jgi:PHD/YefM family antitoxin component YafN of YafNO toxin-antitoxin module